MKYNDSDEWNLIKDYVKSRETNMICVFSSYSQYKEYKEIINSDIVGLTTSNGIEITRKSKHFIERVFGTTEDPKTKRPRSGVEISDIKDSLLKPLKIKEDSKKNSYGFIGEKATITVNPDTGILIQCNPTDSDLVRRLKNV